MKFSKYHGCGNDFIIINERDSFGQDYAKLARNICHPHLGIGADGLIIAGQQPLTMAFYNQDGSLGTMCGNGIRSLAAYLCDNHLVDERTFSINTLAGDIAIEILNTNPYQIAVKMTAPSYDKQQTGVLSDITPFINQKLNYQDREIEVNAVFIGTNHLVVWVDDLETVIKTDLGFYLCHHPLFIDRINVDFVQVINSETFKMKTYERGVGYTLACGTGACASLIIGNLTGKCKDRVEVQLEYGSLLVEKSDNQIYLTGPAVYICSGDYRW